MTAYDLLYLLGLLSLAELLLSAPSLLALLLVSTDILADIFLLTARKLGANVSTDHVSIKS